MKELITSAFLLAALTACSENDAVLENQTTPEKITVSLGIKGEIETSAGPLTKAPDFYDIWGIQIYTIDGENDERQVPYAYALVEDFEYFDQLENLSIDLYPGSKYRFEAIMIPEGTRFLSMIQPTFDGNYGFGDPFRIYERINYNTVYGYGQDVTSGFVYSERFAMNRMESPVEATNGNYDYLAIERFYTKQDIECSANMTSIDLTMKKAFCGIKCMAEGLSGGGQLKFKINNIDNIIEMSLTQTNAELTKMISAADFIKEINGTLNSGYVPLSISIIYIEPNGNSRVLDTVDIQAHRNMLYTINVKLSGEGNNVNNVGTRMLIESTEMTVEETITVENKNGSYSHS